jgi:AcrR family transcriptional regulator
MNKSLKVTAELKVSGELALITAAERLFAQHGIAGVPLRQINQAANQKNIAATHYHFGSKEGLVHAVLQHRWARLDQRREELLRRTDQQRDIRFYLESFILPMAEELAPRAGGNNYLRFIQQYERYRGDYDFAKRVSPIGVEIYAQIENLIRYFPKKIRAIRMEYLINIIHSVLATAEHKLEKREISHQDVPLITSNLIDTVAAALTAPLSPKTIGMV